MGMLKEFKDFALKGKRCGSCSCSNYRRCIWGNYIIIG